MYSNYGTLVYADLSTTITTGGTAQTLAASRPPRKRLMVCNPDPAEDLWIAFFDTTAAPNAEGSLRVPAGGGVLAFSDDVPASAISVYGATSGHKITAWEA